MVGASASFIVLGILGTLLNSLIMRKWRKYKVGIVVCAIGTAIFYFLTFLSAYIKSIPFVLICPGLLGLFEVPMRGQEVAFMCEVGYPVSIFYISNR